MTQDKIIIVVLWVDGSDQVIQKETSLWLVKGALDQEIDGEQRYRDYGILITVVPNDWKACSLGEIMFASRNEDKNLNGELEHPKKQVCSLGYPLTDL